MLDKSERIAIGIVNVKLARAPTLINRAFMDVLGSVRIPGRAQPSLPKLAEDRVNVVGRNDNRLTKFPVATVAGEEESIPVARQRAERRVCEIVIAVDEPHPLARMLELSAAFMAMTFAVFAVYGLFAASLRDRVITRPKAMAWLRRSFAAGFAALGAKLAFAER